MCKVSLMFMLLYIWCPNQLNKENKLFIEQTDLYVKALQARANAEALSSLMAEKRSEIIKKQLGDAEALEAYIAAGKNPFALLGLMFDPDNERFAKSC